MDLTRSCASAIAELGSAGGGGDPVDDHPSLLAMSDTYRVIALQRTHGQARLFKMLDADDLQPALRCINHQQEPDSGLFPDNDGSGPRFRHSPDHSGG